MPFMRDLEKHINQRKSLCFLDLEGTQFSHEMIAIGAIKVDIRKDLSVKKIHKGYYSLVLPKNKIGKVVTDLTGITEADVKKNGKRLRSVIIELKKYLGRDFSKTLFITFGNHDLRILSQSLAYNLDAPKEDIHMMMKHNFDFAEWIANYVKDENNNTYSLANLLKVFEVEFEGVQHNALADTLNLVYLYKKVLERKDILCDEYRKVLAKYRHLPEPLHEVINLLVNEHKSVSPEEFDNLVKEALE